MPCTCHQKLLGWLIKSTSSLPARHRPQKTASRCPRTGTHTGLHGAWSRELAWSVEPVHRRFSAWHVNAVMLQNVLQPWMTWNGQGELGLGVYKGPLTCTWQQMSPLRCMGQTILSILACLPYQETTIKSMLDSMLQHMHGSALTCVHIGMTPSMACMSTCCVERCILANGGGNRVLQVSRLGSWSQVSWVPVTPPDHSRLRQVPPSAGATSTARSRS